MGHEHVVVAPGPRDCEEKLAGAGPNAAEVAARVLRIAGPALPYDPTYHLLWRVDKVRSIVARERPDVLEIHSPYLAAAACLSVPRESFGVRTFVWHADFIDTYLRVMLERRAWARGGATDAVLEPAWAMVRFIGARCDATFVASTWMRDKLVSHGVPRVVLLPFGVDTLRRALAGGRDDVAVLVGVGRFAVEKRWDVVIDAFEVVRRARPCVLVLFGDGPERAAIEARARALGGDLRVMGFEKDRATLAAAMASADALVHGCPFETFGFAVAEALATGLPVVVPDRGGAAGLAEDGCAERYRAGDARDCARAVLSMLARVERGREALEACAIHTASRIPSVRRAVERTYEAYAELLSFRG
jgi:alpha-1,6-mannosyltransferase